MAQRDVAALLARQADLLREEAAVLDALAEAIDPTDARALAAAPAPLARRAVRAWLRDEHPPPAAAVERVLAVARGEAVATDVGGGRRVARSGQRLRLESL
jgi:tRNA(Ile)-lysidine synthase